MENLKIRVNNEAESKEVQDFAKSDGYSRKYNNFTLHKGWVCLNSEKDILCVCHSQAGNELDDYKEITLPELRDLVVLKRNDAGDANYKTNYGTQCYITGEDVYAFQDNKWFLSEMQHKDILDMIKPIKKPMKEYLFKYNDQYTLVELSKEDAGSNPEQYIEVPEGAEIAVKFKNDIDEYGVIFYKNNGKSSFSEKTKFWEHDSNWTMRELLDENHFYGDIDLSHRILWQRHTQPEELPFIDDEPKIETATGYQLDVVGSNTYGSRSRYDGESDISYRQYLMNFIVGNRTESLNDQYAEIEKVRQSHRTASEIADSALKHIRERAETYDQPTGERSAAKTAKAFNAITGKDITESEVWLLLQLLKDVRQWSREDYHQDSAEDCIAYAALKAESLEGGE